MYKKIKRKQDKAEPEELHILQEQPCFMNGKFGRTCTCLETAICPGSSCAFYKTLEQQRAIEERIVRRFQTHYITISKDYRSCIDGRVLLDAKSHNFNCR